MRSGETSRCGRGDATATGNLDDSSRQRTESRVEHRLIKNQVLLEAQAHGRSYTNWMWTTDHFL